MDEITLQILLDIGYGAMILWVVTRALGKQTDAMAGQTVALTTMAGLATAIEENNTLLANNIGDLSNQIKQSRELTEESRALMYEWTEDLPATITNPILEKIEEIQVAFLSAGEENGKHHTIVIEKLDELKEVIQNGNQ